TSCGTSSARWRWNWPASSTSRATRATPVGTSSRSSSWRASAERRRSGRRRLAEELRRRDADHLAGEALAGAVDDPGGVDFADLELQPQLVRVLVEVLEVREAGVVAAFQQLGGDDRLRLHVDDPLPVAAVDVA